MSAQGHFSAGYQSFPLVGPECFRDLKKDAGQADMTKMQPKILNIFRFLQINRILCQVSDIGIVDYSRQEVRRNSEVNSIKQNSKPLSPAWFK